MNFGKFTSASSFTSYNMQEIMPDFLSSEVYLTSQPDDNVKGIFKV